MQYLKAKLSDVQFDQDIIKDAENSTTFSFTESENIAKDVKSIRAFYKKFNYNVLYVLNEANRKTKVQISKKSFRQTGSIYYIVFFMFLISFIACYERWLTLGLFWIIAISSVAVVFIFIKTREWCEYFRDKELSLDEEREHVKFIAAFKDDQKELLNNINDQLFSVNDKKLSILSTIAIVSATMLIAATFQGSMSPSFKILVSILMVVIAISLWAYAAKVEQLIKRVDRFYTNIYTLQLKKPQYNFFRFSEKPKLVDISEKIFAAINELPAVLSISVAVAIFDIVIVIWFPGLIK